MAIPENLIKARINGVIILKDDIEPIDMFSPSHIIVENKKERERSQQLVDNDNMDIEYLCDNIENDIDTSIESIDNIEDDEDMSYAHEAYKHLYNIIKDYNVVVNELPKPTFAPDNNYLISEEWAINPFIFIKTINGDAYKKIYLWIPNETIYNQVNEYLTKEKEWYKYRRIYQI